MIRFIDLGSQIGIDDTWPREFAWFNTVTDTFLNFGGSETWYSWDDFEGDWTSESAFTLERLRSLCQPWVFEVKGNPFEESVYVASDAVERVPQTGCRGSRAGRC